jgi:hypothetical protein
MPKTATTKAIAPKPVHAVPAPVRPFRATTDAFDDETSPYDLYVALCQCDDDTDAVYEASLAKLADPARERSYAEDRRLLIGALLHLEGKQAMLELIQTSCPRLAT